MSTTKECRTCKVTKPLTEFYTHPNGRYGVKESCKLCVDDKKWQWQYGIGRKEVLQMLEDQNYECKICETEIVFGISTKDKMPKGTRRANIDHCHDTGVVRGLLCNQCNQGIGYLQDDITLLEEAIKYLANP